LSKFSKVSKKYTNEFSENLTEYKNKRKKESHAANG
jgi:hypothetical protein